MPCNCDCIIIDKSCIFELTPLNINIGDAKITTCITLAQDWTIKNSMRACYDDFCNALKAEDPLIEKWTNLKEAVKKSLAWGVYKVYLEVYKYELTGHGMFKHENEEKKHLSQSEYETELSVAVKYHELYLATFKKWLKDNEEIYQCSKKESCCCGSEEVKSSPDFPFTIV